ncbi:cytochrome c oxidase subunit 3 [Buchnera aphidicola]|uniref:cytochrome c oxidase subunit 3 n=1 Tax=Buchnera aphidicola TaxID=9 RepID=UPI003BEF41FB
MIKNKIKNIVLNTHNIHEKELENNKLLGFWIYLMSDCIIFAIMFAVYSIYFSNVSIGLIPKYFFKLYFILAETFILLLSSLSCGMMSIFLSKKTIKKCFLYLILTFILGLFFILMEMYEFYDLIINHFGPNKHAFFSVFFTLIGMHGIHIFCGLIWMLFLFYQLVKLNLTNTIRIRFLCFSLFWHFLDIIWVCIFTFVYLNGVI